MYNNSCSSHFFICIRFLCPERGCKSFKNNINNIVKSDAIISAINGVFSAIGVVVPGVYAKYALTAAKMTFKALTAEDADKFVTDAIKEVIKQIGGAGIKIKDSEAQKIT